MKNPLRVLMVEDCADDAELILLELRRRGFDVVHRRVQTAEAMQAALRDDEWELVLSDFSMPDFDAMAALDVLQESNLDLPFIIVSGTIGEDTAVDALKAGAHDFLVKGRLARLVPAIERELRDVQVRAERRSAQIATEEALREQVRAEAASQAKSRVLASMSHELRTPLNAIIGFSELLYDGKVGPLTSRQKEYVETVLSSGQHLLTLVNDVLDLSKLEVGRMEIARERISLATLFREALEMLQPLVERQGVTLELSVPADLPPVLGDPMRLKQVAINLLSNAIKFTPRGGAIHLDACAGPRGVEFAVRDTGVGIQAEDLPRLFREFEQLEPRQGITGTGLGLALTKKLVELHGGSIAVSSEFGRGSTFTVVLPTASPARDVEAA